MPRFLDTRGGSDIAIFICDRCKMKRAHSVAQADPNFPGLLVCDQGCADEKDPYRLAPRPTEKITIRFPRPDVSIATDPNAIETTGNNQFDLSPEQNTQTPSNNGNLDTLTTSPGQ
jgi:hypothetical protein|tara:strand:- start:467 stop:814 length:348 start_codon:yes stop_codon:yes gene_type:complete